MYSVIIESLGGELYIRSIPVNIQEVKQYRNSIYFVGQMIYFKLSIAVVVQYRCSSISMPHLTLLIMKNCFKNNVNILPNKGIKCLSLYSKARVRSVQRSSAFSREQSLLFSVLQGSVLGPVLFKLYTTLLRRII